MPARRHTRARKAVHARRDTEPRTAWVKVALALNVVEPPEPWQCHTSHAAYIPIFGDGCSDLRINQPDATYAPGGFNAHAELGAYRGHITPRCVTDL